MSDIHPVTRARHGAKRWLRSDNPEFVKTTALAPLSAGEISHAALALPLAFVEQQECWRLVAVLGLRPNENICVDAHGQWLAGYVPAIFRAYPFRVGWREGVQPVCCIDERGGSLTVGPEGEAFFDESGELTEAVQEVWSLLQTMAAGEVAVESACKALHAAGVLEPWPIVLEDDGKTEQVSGLFRLSEKALQDLSNEAFGVLRRTGAVGVAYAQLLSKGNLAKLGQAAQPVVANKPMKPVQAKVLPVISLGDEILIDWDRFKPGT